jgi:tetratricopeptide (TPR) repeat protein
MLERVLYRSRLATDAVFFLQLHFPVLRLDGLSWWEFHLRRAVEASLESGLVPVVATVPTNVADIDPGISIRDGLTAGQARMLLETGSSLEATRRWQEAIRFYAGQEDAYPQMKSFLEYRIGRCERSLGRYSRAADRFRSALDTRRPAPNYGRATDLQNDFIRSLGKEYGIPVVDAVGIFEMNSPHGLVGNELFADGHHPNAEGYALLGNAYASALSERLRIPVATSFLDGNDLLRRVGFTPADRLDALLTTGYWLFGVSAAHHYPRPTLELALKSFNEAVSLFPRDFSACLGSALTRAALRGDFMADPGNIEFMSRYKLYYRGFDSLSDSDLEDILSRLRNAGVSDADLTRVRDARR